MGKLSRRASAASRKVHGRPGRRTTGRPRRASTADTSEVLPSIRTALHWPARGSFGVPWIATAKPGAFASSRRQVREERGELHVQRPAEPDAAIDSAADGAADGFEKIGEPLPWADCLDLLHVTGLVESRD